MTPAQAAALRRVVAAGEPVKVAPATAAVLSERYGYIEVVGARWAATAKGRARLEGDDHEARYRARSDELGRESRDWAERVMAWLGCHGYIGGLRHGELFVAKRYAEHYAACLHAGLEPVRPEGETDWIERDVDMAARCLRDFDEAELKARARDCGVEVTYKTAPSHPKAKADAAATVTKSDGTVDLRAYRLARGDSKGGPAA